MSESVELLKKIVSLNPKGEHRPQQETAVEEIECALNNDQHLLIEAPTGSGKTFAYMVPLIHVGTKAVVSTATKQLSEQIMKTDVPFLQKALKNVAPGKKFSAALLKGRENYYCLKRDAEAGKLEDESNTLFGTVDVGMPSAKGKAIAKETAELKAWADVTTTGDRSEAPAVSEQTWKQYSVTSSECPGRAQCPFGDVCFAEIAREKARKATIVVTNHAVVANDLIQEGEGILGERDAYVFDELHELDNYLSSAWGTQLSAKSVKDAHKAFKQYGELNAKSVDDVEKVGKMLDKALLDLSEGPLQSTPHKLGELLTILHAATTRIGIEAGKTVNDKTANEAIRNVVSVLKKRADELSEAAALLLNDSIEIVRWVNVREDVPYLHAAPLRVGPKLQDALSARNATMIGTSATITVAGSFDIPVHNLDLNSSESFKTVALDSPFDFSKQAMMYIPDPSTFPAPVGADRKDHTEAVRNTSVELIKATDGRALVLSTTTSGAKYIADFLRRKLPKMNIMLQGDAPPAQLVEEFREDEKSVLVATMGMWHGLDVPGQALSLVIIDKIPFKPMDEPLSVARQRYAEENGRSGFMDVYVADANVMLAQGVGRLIRSTVDRGIVAVLDTRLLSKPYGKSMLASLPPIKIYTKKDIILSAASRLVKDY